MIKRIGYTVLVTAVIPILAMILFIPACVCTWVPPWRNTAYRIGCFWLRMWFVTAGADCTMKGLENLPEEPMILVSNHASYFDVPAIMGWFPVQFWFLAKKTLVYIPVFGWALPILGHIIIDRSKRERAMESLDRAAEKIRKGKNVLIFPQGGRWPPGVEGFRKGAFVLAAKTGVPLVPIAVCGSDKVHKRGDWTVSQHMITVKIGMPIHTGGCTYEDRDRLMQEAKSRIQEMLQ